MGKYDDFNLDLKKIKGNGEAQPMGITTVSPIIASVATECYTINGGNTCNCPSTACSPSDATGCRSP